ncbi:hypothetical protein SAMN05446935_6561 [Burkholderia sp. YR290]|jgi:hypothetical protein|nr:hypothetical protein SAMN05446934_5215 [Paraburkholderia hospita]SOE86067.1 hypothetical protein SAMN05446935_6561 [Burkholderia sp. YR290]
MQVDACCLGRFRPTAAVASSTAKWTTAVLSLCRTSVTGPSLQFCHSGCGTTAICRKAPLRQTKLAGWRSNHAHAGQNEKISGISRDGGPGCSGVDDKAAWSPALRSVSPPCRLQIEGFEASANTLWKPMAIPSSKTVSVSSHAGAGNQRTCPVRIHERHITARRTVRLGGPFFARSRKRFGIRSVECWPPACPSVLA